MKILSATFNDFKRFKKLEIKSLPSTTKMVILVGPNGSGKSSVLDGFLQWYRKIRFGPNEEQMAYYMRGLEAWKNRQSVYQNQIIIEFNGAVPETWDGRKDLFYFRSAYRFEGSFTLDSISRFDPIEEDQRIAIMSDSDVSVSKNYARLVGKIVADLHDTSDDNVSKGKWR